MTTTVSRFLIPVCYFLALFLLSLVTSEGQESSKNENAKVHLLFGFDVNVILYVDIKEARVALDRWMTKLAEENDIEQASYVFNDFESLLNSMKTGQINAACTSSLNYLYLSRICEVEASYGAIRKEKKAEKYLLIVPSNSEISEIKTLKGKKLIMREADDIGLLYLKTLLLRNKLGQTEEFFSETTYMKNAAQVVLSIFFGKADACISTEGVFNTMIELNPQVGRKLKVLAASDEMVSVVGCFRKNADPQLKQKVQDWLVDFKNKVTGKQLLALFKMESIFRMNESDLNSIRELLNEYESLQRKYVLAKPENINRSKNYVQKK